jgi:Endoplasmic Reticulum-Golgi Intermediate Compartment (ERGIC)
MNVGCISMKRLRYGNNVFFVYNSFDPTISRFIPHYYMLSHISHQHQQCTSPQRLVTNLLLDTNAEKKVRLNFNITMMDLKCEYCVVDVVSVLGTEQNVSSHVTKWHVDAAGVRQRYQGRNKQQKDIDLFDSTVKDSLAELYENGEDAVSLDEDTFAFALKHQEYVFVDFFAPW